MPGPRITLVQTAARAPARMRTVHFLAARFDRRLAAETGDRLRARPTLEAA